RAAGRLAVHVARVPKGQMRLYPAASRFQAVSTAIRDAVVREIPWAADRVKVFPNPIHTDVFTPLRTQPRQSSKTVLFTGRIHPEKGIELLVRAFRIAAADRSDLELNVVGPWKVEQGGGGEEYLARLRGLAEGVRVRFTPPV